MGVTAGGARVPGAGTRNALSPGRFIVIEGIDGAGTTTLAARLANALPRGRLTCEPSNQALGSWLRRILNSPEGAPPSLKAPETLALLFAADRYMHLAAEVEPWLAEGDTVISDRYLYSSVGYQSYGAAQVAARQAWIKGLQPWARPPDLTLLVLVSPQTAQTRRETRGAVRGLLEDEDRQTWLADYYRELPRLFPDHSFACLNGEASPDEVFAAALAVIANHLGLTLPSAEAPTACRDESASGARLEPPCITRTPQPPQRPTADRPTGPGQS